jgi:mRNA-degrading endonuclease RelE of RelBE toxin-antitoxin system
MDYKPKLSPKAAKEFKSLPPEIQDAVAARIDEICKSPSKHS